MGASCSTKYVGLMGMESPTCSQSPVTPLLFKPHASTDMVDGSAEYIRVLCVPTKRRANAVLRNIPNPRINA